MGRLIIDCPLTSNDWSGNQDGCGPHSLITASNLGRPVSPYHGDSQHPLFWCDRCNVPLIGKYCGKCGDYGELVDLAPPGEVRLALEGTKRRLRYLFLRQFGVQQIVPEVVILNKTSGEDRADEVIIDGRRVAKLAYDLEKKDYSLMLRLDGARMLAARNTKKLINLSKAEGHMKGKHLPPEFIESYDPGIREGDEVVIQMGKFIGCGTAKVNASQLKINPKGVRVRDFAKFGPLRSGKRAWTKAVIRANEQYLSAKKAKAEHEIKGVLSKHDLPLTVSFSGGKDSLVVLDIVRSITNDFTVVYIDTGLEHPQTREYVEKIRHSLSLRLITASAGNAFDEHFDAFGPPAKDFRWCCKVCKLAPVSQVIEENFPQGTVTVEGNRKLESFARSRLELVDGNPFVPGQVIVNPIRDWTGLDVWLYIIWRKLQYNELYDEDIERVGCWMCPSALASECAEISRISPNLAKVWEMRLNSWAEQHDLPREFVAYGFWRWKELPPKMRELSEKLGIKIDMKRADTLSLRLVKGVSPCMAGGYSIEAVLDTPQSRGFQQVAEVLKTIGDVRTMEDFGVAMVDTNRGRGKVFAAGQISSVADSPKESSVLFDKLARAVLRANLCTSCGICVRACPKGAIKVDNGIFVDSEKCTRCGKCEDSCVVAHYFDKLAGNMEQPTRKVEKKKRKR